MGVQAIPSGFHTITPYVVATGAVALMDFLKRGLGAEVMHLSSHSDGSVMHATLRIGDSMMMLSDARGSWPARPTDFYLYVTSADEWYERAMGAGAVSIKPPTNEFYGDRVAGVTDASGNRWWFSTHVEDVSEEEMKRRQAEMFGKK